ERLFDPLGVTADHWTIQHRMEADGSHLQRLTDAPTDELAPTWSPDGRSIAFVRSERGELAGDLRVADADGAHEHVVYRRPVTFAAWSPDGGRMALTSMIAGHHHV